MFKNNYKLYISVTLSFETKTKVSNMANDVPKAGGYNLDFDKFDDPNFNPFETKTKVVEVALPSNEKKIEAGTPEKSPEESSPLKLQPETDVTKRKYI